MIIIIIVIIIIYIQNLQGESLSNRRWTFTVYALFMMLVMVGTALFLYLSVRALMGCKMLEWRSARVGRGAAGGNR